MRTLLLPLPLALVLGSTNALAADPATAPATTVPAPAATAPAATAPAATAPAAMADGAPDAGGASDPQEWATFQDTLERYKERMTELQGDARAILDADEAEQRAKISSSYGGAIRRLEDSESALRRVAVTRIEAFLAKYPDSPHTPDMLFRLADLYFEETEVAFLGEMDDYGRLELQVEKNPSMALPPPPLKDYTRSIDLYRRIIAKYPDYENVADTYYMLAWCESAQNAAQYDPDAARDVYLTIVDRFPKSPFANDANMRLGEYYFDLPGTRAEPTKYVATAIAYYEAVLADGPTGRNYDEAIYKLGWSHYKINDYDRALAYLVQLLDYSDAQFLETGKVSSMRPEAVEYLAISYADIADRQGKPAVDIATAHLKRVGERKWQHDVVERLAEILLVQAKFEASIETFRYLQTRWPLDPNNPVYQDRISSIYAHMPIPDPARSDQALAELSEKYTEGTPWYNANKSNPDAIAKARGFIETSLAQVATEYLIRAQQTGSVQDYALAADKFRDFLDKFPFADRYNEYEWYRALALFGSNQFGEAEKQYLQILKNDRSPFRDGARFQLMKSREQLVLAKYGKLEIVPPDAVVERVDKTAFGKEVTRYMISDEQKAYIQSCDDLAQREFTDPAWAPELEKNRAALTYIPAQILYYHGHYDEARARLQKVMDRFPHNDEAAYAAQLYVNTYTIEGDLQSVADSTERFMTARYGQKPGDINSGLGPIREQAKFNIPYALIEKGDRAGAAAGFLAFMKEFPKSVLYKDALYNAANSLEIIGKAEESNKLFEQYIAAYPSDERSPPLYFRIADNYSSTLQLDRAITYYEQLVKLFPAYVDSPAALFNAAFLRVGVGDHEGAARTFERYATQFPNQPDAESAYWRAGEQWAQVSDNDALDFYGRYVKRYPSTDANHVIEAWYRTAKLYEKRGDARKATQAWASVQLNFGAAPASALSARTRSLAAEGALKSLVARYEAFKGIKWTNSEAKNVDLLVKVKGDELKAITEAAVQLIQTYQDYDTAAAALYLQGMAYFAYADISYSIPSPPGLSEEEEGIFRDAIDQKFRIPSEDRGKARLVAAMEKARGEKRWSEWNTKALAALNDKFPAEYPMERKESRGAASPGAMPMAGPESIVTDPTAPEGDK
jgi:TolA-binding protein